MKKIALMLICAILVCAAACGAPAQQGRTDAGKENGASQTSGDTQSGKAEVKPLVGYVSSADAKYPEKVSWNDRQKIWENRNANKVEESFLNAVNGFAFESAKRLLAADKNSCYSPLSLYYALAVCASGAAGETQKEMLSALGVRDAKELADGCRTLFKRLWLDSDGTQIKLSDALFVDDEYQGVRKEYADDMTEDFFASLRTIDFDDTAKAKEELSKYISENTAGKLTYQGDPDPSVEVMIINTLYFISRWSDQFNERSTNKSVFHAPSGDVECDMMYKYFMSLGFSKGDGFIRIELPFEDGSRMAFVLPDEGRLADVISSGAEAFTGGERGRAKTHLYLPKFKIRYDVDHLETFLKEQMGISKAFDPYGADFSTMSELPLYISKVFQATYISVDENGAEAAAYTEIDMRAGAAFDPSEPIELRFDRPFLYAIESVDGTVLFTGVVADPTAK